MRDKDLEEFLLYLDSCESSGKTLSEAVTGLDWSKDRTAKAIGIAENSGMVRGNWERLLNRRWVRRFYIAGEGTRDYIETLKKYFTSGETTNG